MQHLLVQRSPVIFYSRNSQTASLTGQKQFRKMSECSLPVQTCAGKVQALLKLPMGFVFAIQLHVCPTRTGASFDIAPPLPGQAKQEHCQKSL